jgi:hypothetical protein
MRDYVTEVKPCCDAWTQEDWDYTTGRIERLVRRKLIGPGAKPHYKQMVASALIAVAKNLRRKIGRETPEIID